LMFLLVAAFLAMILVIVALLFYVRRTRPRPSGDPQADEVAPPPEILVRRKAWAGRMEVVINGRAYRRMKDIEDAAVRRAVMLAVGDLVTFAGEAAGLAAKPPVNEPPAFPDGGPTSVGKQYAPPKELAEHALLAQMEQAQLNTQPPEGWLGALARGLGARYPGGRGSRGFVDEIEEILQRRRKEKGIPQEVHVRTDGQGIVRLEVDKVLYDSPGDIPNLAVKELVRAAVGEWEAGY